MKVILLLGASSAGKSTLCNALVKEYGWYTHGDDQVMDILEKERTPLLLAKLKERGLIEQLSPYMSESAIMTLASTGQFNLVYGDISIQHQFKNPDFQDLEAILSRAGFSDKELQDLTRLFHEVGEVFKTLPMRNPVERMLDDVFQLEPDSSVIIDSVPEPHGDVKAMLDDFKEKLVERAKLEGRSIEFATVLTYFPPKALSARIKHRNEEAVISGDLKNMREGTFPFFQLSQLIATKEADGKLDEARTLSKMQLLLIALQHVSPRLIEGESKKAKAIFKAGAHEYRELMKRFRLTETNNVTVSPREDLDAHAVIDLSQDASPSDLAREFLAKTMNVPPLSFTPMGQSM